MSNQGEIKIQPGNALEEGGVTSNVATETARAALLKEANVDGKAIFPETVSTKHFQAEEMFLSEGSWLADGIINAGHLVTTEEIITASAQIRDSLIVGGKLAANTITANKLTISNIADIASVFTGSLTVGTDASVGGAATGVWLTNQQFLMKYGGINRVDFNSAAGTFKFTGEISADKITISSNAANSVNFGSAVTIGGNLTVNSSVIVNGNIVMDGPGTTGRTIYWDTASGYGSISYDVSTYQMFIGSNRQTGSIYVVAGQVTSSNQVYINMTGAASANMAGMTLGVSAGTNCITTLQCGSSSTSRLYLQRGSTTVMSFAGNSSTVTFSGFVTAVGLSSSASIYGAHKTTGGAALANGTYTFGGAYTFTMTDGLVTATNGVGPT